MVRRTNASILLLCAVVLATIAVAAWALCCNCEPPIYVNLEVSKDGGNTWEKSVTVCCGETVQYRVSKSDYDYGPQEQQCPELQDTVVIEGYDTDGDGVYDDTPPSSFDTAGTYTITVKVDDSGTGACCPDQDEGPAYSSVTVTVLQCCPE